MLQGNSVQVIIIELSDHNSFNDVFEEAVANESRLHFLMVANESLRDVGYLDDVLKPNVTITLTDISSVLQMFDPMLEKPVNQ